MNEMLLSKFKVAIEIASFISYVKYVDKRENESVDRLADKIHNLVKLNPQVEKSDIKSLIELNTNAISASMFKDEKFSYCYNTIIDRFVAEDVIVEDDYDAPFVIKVSDDVARKFNREEITNYITDLYKDDFFLLDVRYYGVEKKYITVDFEVYLSNSEIVLKTQNNIYIDYLLNQYKMKEIIEGLDLSTDVPYKGNFLTQSSSTERVIEAYTFNKSLILEYLVYCYETSPYIFINHSFLKHLDIKMEDVIIKSDESKLIIILESSSSHYFNYAYSNSNDRIEYSGTNQILYVSENLFREACGNASHVVIMGQSHYLALNKLNSQFDEFIYLTRNENHHRYMETLIDTYLKRSQKQTSFVQDLKLYSFILDEETLNRTLNYYLSNTLKSTSITAFNFKNRSKDHLPFNDIKMLIELKVLNLTLSKNMVVSFDNMGYLLDNLQYLINKLKDIDMITEYFDLLNKIMLHFDDQLERYESKLNEIKSLLDIRTLLLTKAQEVHFIIDTSALIDEPDLLQKYFSGKSTVVHSIVKDELEQQRGTNLNAIRAIRNINLFTNDPKIQLKLVYDNDVTDSTKSTKIMKFESLMANYLSEGKRPVLISSDVSTSDLYESNKSNIVQLKNIPLILT